MLIDRMRVGNTSEPTRYGMLNHPILQPTAWMYIATMAPVEAREALASDAIKAFDIPEVPPRYPPT